jgi:large subunit ribosomal protein L5
MNRLQEKYQKEVLPALQKELGRTNILSLPRPEKVVVNVGISKKEGQDTTKALESMATQLMTITGQKPKATAAKKSIAGFKIRAGDNVGLCVTLRENNMWEFMDKLISIVLPRMKDFQGISRKSFDNSGNYSIGFVEQIVFPEIEYDKIDKIRGLQVTIVSSGNDTKESLKMLELLGMPFEKEDK